MGFWTRIAAHIGLLFLLAGCIELETRLIDPKGSVRPLATPAGMVDADGARVVFGAATGGYQIPGAIMQAARTVSLERIGGDVYLVQQEEKAKSPLYTLAIYRNQVLATLQFKAQDATRAFQAAYGERFSDGAESKRRLLALFAALLDTKAGTFGYRLAFEGGNSDHMELMKTIAARDKDSRSRIILDAGRTVIPDPRKEMVKALAAVVRPRVAQNKGGGAGSRPWRLRSQTDALTGSHRMTLSATPARSEGVATRASLAFTCRNRSIDVRLDWGQLMADYYPMPEHRAIVTRMRMDDGPILKHGWWPSQDWTSAGPPGPLMAIGGGIDELIFGAILPNRRSIEFAWTADRLIDGMARRATRTLVLQAPARNGRDVTLVFDMRGFATAARRLAGGCR